MWSTVAGTCLLLAACLALPRIMRVLKYYQVLSLIPSPADRGKKGRDRPQPWRLRMTRPVQ